MIRPKVSSVDDNSPSTLEIDSGSTAPPSMTSFKLAMLASACLGSSSFVSGSAGSPSGAGGFEAEPTLFISSEFSDIWSSNLASALAFKSPLASAASTHTALTTVLELICTSASGAYSVPPMSQALKTLPSGAEKSFSGRVT